MGAHAVVHRRPDVSLKSALAQRRGAPKRKPRVAFASMVITTPHRPWVSESELEARRARTLMEDNPTSG
jgi:hypothetical protein